MKARVKATGAIYIVPDYVTISVEECNSYGTPLSFSLDEIEILDEDNTALSREQGTLDYWTRLKHQYTGMAMQALLLTNNVRNGDLEGMRECNTNAMAIAYALVEKLKEKEERK